VVTPAIQIPVRQAGVEIVSYYNTEMTAAARLLRRQSPLDVPKDTVDYRFHTRFQQDFYQTIILAKAGIASEAQWVDWTHMANLGHEICDEVAQMCEDRHIKDIMGFQHDWNKEVIAQFYATVYFGHDPENGNKRTIYWMTEGHHYQCSYTSVCRYLRLDDQDVNRPMLHYDLPLSADQVRFMYPRDRIGNAGKVMGLYTYYSILNRLFRTTLTPRDGNPSDISAHAKNLMSRMQPDPRGGDFSVADFIWEEIKHRYTARQEVYLV